jgi:hypothetical protein
MAFGRGQSRNQASSGLNAGFFIRTKHEVVFVQRLAIPGSVIQIQDTPCALFERGIAGPDPTAITPRTDSICTEPTPHRCSADGSNHTTFYRLAGNLITTQAGERQPEVLGQLTGQRLDFDHDLRGGKTRGRPRLDCSSRPTRRLSKKRLRHFDTICRGKSSRSPISLLDKPWQAKRTTLARMTSRYGDVYFRAIDSKYSFSLASRRRVYGLLRGMLHLFFQMWSIAKFFQKYNYNTSSYL